MSTLLDLPGNFADGYSFEAFEFEEGSGDYAGLFVPSRTLAVAGPSTVALTRPSGKRGRGVAQPASCTQWVEADYDNTWNALANFYDWLTVAFWFKNTDSAGQQGFGIAGASGSIQWYIELSEIGIGLVNSSDTGPSISTGLAPTENQWYHVVAQFHYDGVGTGTDLKLSVNGTDYPTVSGSKAITPNFPTTTQFETTLFESNARGMVIDQLIFRKSSTEALDETSILALYNGGNGIQLVKSRGAARNRSRSRNRASDAAIYRG